MNQLLVTHNRPLPGGDAVSPHQDEETLVADSRAALTPSQVVEQRLIGMMKGASLPVCYVQQWRKPGPR